MALAVAIIYVCAHPQNKNRRHHPNHNYGEVDNVPSASKFVFNIVTV